MGWLEQLYLDPDPKAPPPTRSAEIRLGYPVRAVYAHHPSGQQWRTRDGVQTINYPVRVGEVIGYAGKTDSAAGALEDSFHFEIFTAENNLVKAMKPLEPSNIARFDSSYQEYQDNNLVSDGMGKVWLTRDAHLMKIPPLGHSSLTPADIVQFSAGACFITAIPCDKRGNSKAPGLNLTCFMLLDLNTNTAPYYAYANQTNAAADSSDLVKDAWVTLTTDSDWTARGWQAYEDKELNTTDDAFVEDDNGVMQKIVDAAHTSSATLSLEELHSAGVEAILRRVAVQFHTEWDSSHNATRYQKLKTGAHPPLPRLTDAQFNAFIKDAEGQQFWTQAQVYSDGVTGPDLDPQKKLVMNAKNWHYHPIGFLAQMRECLTTDVSLSEEIFEMEVRQNWNIELRMLEKRCNQLKPWQDVNSILPSAPVSKPVAEQEYHATFWENFVYWFGIDPNAGARPDTLGGARPFAPAGHHVFNYVTGMIKIFRHISMQRIMKGARGNNTGGYIFSNHYPHKPPQPAQGDFNMEYVHIGAKYGLGYPFYGESNHMVQNRMQLQLHEVSHMYGAAYAKDQVIDSLPADGPNGNSAYGPQRARMLAKSKPDLALANAENIAFFIESIKYEPEFYAQKQANPLPGWNHDDSSHMLHF